MDKQSEYDLKLYNEERRVVTENCYYPLKYSDGVPIACPGVTR